MSAERPPRRRRVALAAFAAIVVALAASYAGLRIAAREPFAAERPYVGFLAGDRAVLVRAAPEAVEIVSATLAGPSPADAPRPVTAAAAAAAYHAIALGPLVAGGTYTWTLEERLAKTGVQRRFEGRFRAPPAAGPVRFEVMGDGGKTRVGTPWKSPGRQGDIVGLEAKDGPDFILYCGDIVYNNGAREEYAEGFFRPFAPLLAAGIPVYPALGNHDLKTEYADPYFAAFPIPSEGPGGGHYYSFDWGDVHLAVLDTSSRRLERDPAQLAWLARDLAASKKRWKLVAGHHPPFHGRRATGLDAVLPPLLAREGVAAYLCGHYHVYERCEPGDGVVYLTSGGGGQRLQEAEPSPHSKRIVSRYHYLRAAAGPEKLIFEAVGLEGEVFDRVEIPAR